MDSIHENEIDLFNLKSLMVIDRIGRYHPIYINLSGMTCISQKGFRMFLYIVMINLHNILVKHLVLSLDGNKWKLQNNWNFSKSTKHKSVENCWITPKIQLQLETLMKICIINFTIATSAKEMKKNCLLTDRPTDRQQ